MEIYENAAALITAHVQKFVYVLTAAGKRWCEDPNDAQNMDDFKEYIANIMRRDHVTMPSDKHWEKLDQMNYGVKGDKWHFKGDCSKDWGFPWQWHQFLTVTGEMGKYGRPCKLMDACYKHALRAFEQMRVSSTNKTLGPEMAIDPIVLPYTPPEMHKEATTMNALKALKGPLAKQPHQTLQLNEGVWSGTDGSVGTGADSGANASNAVSATSSTSITPPQQQLFCPPGYLWGY